MAILHERIKEQRLKRGYTLLQIAEMLNVREATVQRYESGEIKNIKHETITKLSEILGCSPAYLMGWSNDIPQNNSVSSLYKIPILEKYNRLNFTGQEKADIYITDLLENPKYVAESYQDDYASVAADTGKGGKVPAPSLDTIIELNQEEQ